MPTNEIRHTFEQIHLFLQKSWASAVALWETIPSQLRTVLIVVFAVACINIAISLIKATIDNRATWKKKADSELMYSFSAGSGQFQRSHIYRDAHKYLFDKNGLYSVLPDLPTGLATMKTTQKHFCF